MFAACVLAAAAGMAWLTQQALRADERRRAAEAESELDQRVSLALWRMDTELAPILAAEVIRPSAEFRPTPGEPTDPPAYVLLQFECRPNGQCVSPQVATGKSKGSTKLAELSAAVKLPQLIATLPSTTLPTVAEAGSNFYAPNSQSVSIDPNGDNSLEFLEGNSANAKQQQDAQVQQPQATQPAVKGAKPNSAADFEQRNKRYQSVAQQSLLNFQPRGGPNNNAANMPANAPGIPVKSIAAPEQLGVSRPVWVGNRLLLARRVSSKSETVVQGSWLDWPQLKARLLAEATDLLSDADLVPVNGSAQTDPARMLAGLPVRLVVNEQVAAGTVGPTLRWALEIGWGAVLLAVIAAAFLLQGVITLSERRAAFVSSVTHELRTPLTTFRMYSEMLARGMVPDANQRQEYFSTLQRESERLTLLVENVLAYARLERGRRPQAQDRVTLADRCSNGWGRRLKQRAAQAGMQCVIELEQYWGTVEHDARSRSPEGAKAT